MSNQKRRPPIVGRYTQEELALASRNSGMPLEALRYDLTPAGLHYLLIHFDIPAADAFSWRLRIDGLVSKPQAFSLADLQRMPASTARVTMECAGNGRGQTSPRYPSMPWLEEGVSTADWYGMASVKWLERIEVIDHAFEGVQQMGSYHFRSVPGEKGAPCTRMRVNSLMALPGHR